MTVDEGRLHEFLGKAVGDLGAAVSASLTLIGDRLGLYKALARNGPALGAQAGEARMRRVLVDEGGFSRFRRAAETPFNIVLEARP
ncbi:MAG TPA: hypothetical protein VFY97_03345 [Rhodanobacteraceae bacterium]|nr:hypothetical protein [Rhodanobacteraceae bacterium]